MLYSVSELENVFKRVFYKYIDWNDSQDTEVPEFKHIYASI